MNNNVIQVAVTMLEENDTEKKQTGGYYYLQSLEKFQHEYKIYAID